jgi:S1-C subfamily serine protease
MRRVALILAALAVLLGGCGGSSDDDGNKQPALGSGDNDAKAAQEQQATSRVEVIKSIGHDGGFDPRAIYKSEAPGVVTVVSLFGSGGLGSLLNGDDGGDGGGGVGSGFVLDRTGEIVTNAHVVTSGEGDAIKRAREVYVAFADGNQVRAKIVGTDPNADVALLKIATDGLALRPLPLGDSAGVEVGEPVAAIGSPFNERQSLSVGVISAVDRTIESLTSFSISGAFQTDAAINPGNSGGPLVDGDGRVIGINQQIKSTSGGGEGVGFAVPIDAVKRSVSMLREDGEARYAYLGVSSVELYPQLVDRFGLDVDKGAWVQEVSAGGPAARAGIRGGGETVEFQAQTFRTGGDIISKVAGKAVEDSADLADEIANFKPGDTVPLEVRRDGQTKEIRVKLGERPLGRVAG